MKFARILVAALLLTLLSVFPAFAQEYDPHPISQAEFERIRVLAEPMPFPDISKGTIVAEPGELLFKYDPAERPVPQEWLVAEPKKPPTNLTEKSSKAKTRITNTEEFPYSSVVHLLMEYGSGYGACSGSFVLNKSTVLTAAHCVYDEANHRYPDNIYVIPAEDGDQRPFGYKAAYNFAASSAYISHGDYTQDYGLIQVQPFNGDTGYMNLIWDSDYSWYYARDFDTAGYPGDLGFPGDEMWWDRQGVDEVIPRMMQVDYRFSSYPYYCIPGQSGSAIYIDEGDGWAVAAVLTLASCHGVRLNQTIASFLGSGSCPGCSIGGECYLEGDQNPNNDCQACNPDNNTSNWSVKNSGSCDDGLYCNGADSCDNGECKEHDGDPCGSGETCDEQLDSCVEGGSCSELLELIYNTCDLSIIASGEALTGDDAYEMCKGNKGPWDCLRECAEHEDVDDCGTFSQCLDSKCDVSVDSDSGDDDDDDDDNSGGSCGGF
jgi:V8-like Glu-specific endopeptidase